MEDVLILIIKEATGNKFSHLRNAAQNAHGTNFQWINLGINIELLAN